MTSNLQNRALASLMQTAKVGGFALPVAVTDAYDVWQKLVQVELPAPRTFEPESAAAEILRAASNGDRFEPMDLCRDALKVQEDQRLHLEAEAALAIAINQAASNAVASVGSVADEIVTEHLRPAYEDVMAKARDVASVLRPYTDPGYQVDAHGVIGATSTKVRAAYLELPALVERMLLIRQARDRVNTVAGISAERDTSDMFLSFQRPLAFHPNWRHPAPIPPLPAPVDPAARLLWTVSDQAAQAGPWLPTVAEQDAAWWDQFGQVVTQRQIGGAIAGSRGVAAVA